MNDKYVVCLCYGGHHHTFIFKSPLCHHLSLPPPPVPCKKKGFCFNLQCIEHNVLCVILSLANEDKGDLFVNG